MPSPDAADDGLVRRLREAGCVFAEDEARLLRATADTDDELERLALRRVAGEPLEHLLGFVDFCGARLAVGPGVFVPRARTGLLVREAVEISRRQRQSGPRTLRHPPVVVDLCCGCGAVAAAVARALGAGATAAAQVEVHAADIDPVAVAYARRNLADVGGTAYAGDLFDALPEGLHGRVDVLVVNAPYVPSDEVALMPPEARVHEPRSALDGGPDGLDVHRRVAAGAREWLTHGGVLVLESSRRQAGASAALLEAGGLAEVRVVRDDDVSGTAVRGLRP